MITMVGIASALASLVPASACVPGAALPFVIVKPVPFGPAGSQITVEGLHFLAAPIELRWNGVDGPLLQGAASASGPSFSATAIVPDEPPGLYALVVLSRRADGSIADTAQVAFQLTGSNDGVVAPSPRLGQPGISGQASPAESSLGDDVAWVVFAAAALVALGGAGGVILARQRRR